MTGTGSTIYLLVLLFSLTRDLVKKSIPERIANGNLDGDLYLVCWNKNLLSCMKAEPLKDEIQDDNGTIPTIPSNQNWFKDA